MHPRTNKRKGMVERTTSTSTGTTTRETKKERRAAPHRTAPHCTHLDGRRFCRRCCHRRGVQRRPRGVRRRRFTLMSLRWCLSTLLLLRLPEVTLNTGTGSASLRVVAHLPQAPLAQEAVRPPFLRPGHHPIPPDSSDAPRGGDGGRLGPVSHQLHLAPTHFHLLHRHLRPVRHHRHLADLRRVLLREGANRGSRLGRRRGD